MKGQGRTRALAGIAAAAIAIGAGAGLASHEVTQSTSTTTTTLPTCTETERDCVLEPALTAQAERELSPEQKLGAVTPPPEASVEPFPAIESEGALSLGAVTLPSGTNGALTAKQLSPITGGVSGFPGSGQLANAPAAAWNTAAVRIHNATGIWITTNGPDSAYRSRARQDYWVHYWCSRGACGNAAPVGRSNHGYGWAIDTSTQTGSLLDRYGAPYGFRRSCSDANWEPWHWKWCGGWSGRDPGPYGRDLFHVIKRGSKGKRVLTLTSRLALLNPPGKRDHFIRWSNRSRKCGKVCAFGIRSFQRAEHLGADGVYGPNTDARLDARWRFFKRHRGRHR